MSKPIISSVRVRAGEVHDVVTVFSRGGNAGELIVDRGDGDEIADRLCGDDCPREVVRRGDETVYTPLDQVEMVLRDLRRRLETNSGGDPLGVGLPQLGALEELLRGRRLA